MRKPVISIIIPFHGAKDDLKVCLDLLKTQTFTFPCEIIIVKSGRDSEVNSITNKIPNVLLLCSDKVMPPGFARNLGVKHSSAPLLAFTDADCAPSPGWLLELYNSLQENEVVIGPVLNLYPFHPFASVDNLLQFTDFQKYGNNAVSHFPACNLGMRKEVFLNTHGFPENLLTGEDVYFSQQVIKSGIKVFYNKELIIRHSGRRTFSGLLKHNRTLGYYRGLYQLKIKSFAAEKNPLLYSVYYSLRRFLYITIKTLQWNPSGLLRLLFYFPIFAAGLYAWGRGFYYGSKYRLKGSLYSKVIYQDNS